MLEEKNTNPLQDPQKIKKLLEKHIKDYSVTDVTKSFPAKPQVIFVVSL